jgi:hypothetical protein
VTGLGSEFRYQDRDVVMMYRAVEANIAKITQPQTTTSLESNQPSKPRAQPQGRVERDWISQLAADEASTSGLSHHDRYFEDDSRSKRPWCSDEPGKIRTRRDYQTEQVIHDDAETFPEGDE